MRALYTSINNKYVYEPKMAIDYYDISVEQKSETIRSVVGMEGTALAASEVFIFCLNPGLRVEEVKDGEKSLNFKREEQILAVDFGREIEKGDTISFSVSYEGRIKDDFCYLDIPEEVLQQPYDKEMLKLDKKYSFQTSDYVLFTPETYWYPRPGTGYSDKSPDWQQTYFSRFRLDESLHREGSSKTKLCGIDADAVSTFSDLQKRRSARGRETYRGARKE
jgi:hypothetical protein